MTRYGFLLSMVGGIAAAATAMTASAQQGQNCEFEDALEAEINAADAERLDLIARGGSLVIEGRLGSSEVRVRGRACASSQALLDEISLEAERVRDDVRVEAVIDSELQWARGDYAVLHLVIEVPQGLAAEVNDSSGPIEIRGVGNLSLTDGSGSIEVEGVAGALTIRDGSGSIRVADAAGDVNIVDGSGTIDVRDVGGSIDLEDGSGSVSLSGIGGSVVLSDGSGSIEASDVTGNVTVRRDGSGSIYAARVEGDFVVERDGSGEVVYDRIGGSVRTPRRR